ncbi:unnamed protein product [Adineta ricciae]|uniref:Uncharacterized protein n=1 Tax=Adineta ricciae TaxID=249248 RepID=A0A815DGP8_ADIRI|nr:unnamed protein product [Adineta ricciae]
MAFTILIYKNFYQFQILIETLYIQTNFYCIHIDLKASKQIYEFARILSNCLENVFLLNQRFNISWGTFSILQVERLCQQILIERSSKWFYYMTIAGSELPIETNRNRLEILQLINDKTRVDISSIPQYKNRQRSKVFPPPNNVTIYKGEFHTILTRKFLNEILHDNFSNEIFFYLNETSVPDEHFYSTLIQLKHLSSFQSRTSQFYPYYELLSHYKHWKGQPFTKCLSEIYIEGICQFNYKDLFFIEQSHKLFLNKFNQDLDLISIFCWNKWLNVKQNHHVTVNIHHYLNQFPFTTINSTFNSTFDEDFQKMIKYLYRE